MYITSSVPFTHFSFFCHYICICFMSHTVLFHSIAECFITSLSNCLRRSVLNFHGNQYELPAVERLNLRLIVIGGCSFALRNQTEPLLWHNPLRKSSRVSRIWFFLLCMNNSRLDRHDCNESYRILSSARHLLFKIDDSYWLSN
jgi:hypothetical protein